MRPACWWRNTPRCTIRTGGAPRPCQAVVDGRVLIYPFGHLPEPPAIPPMLLNSVRQAVLQDAARGKRALPHGGGAALPGTLLFLRRRRPAPLPCERGHRPGGRGGACRAECTGAGAGLLLAPGRNRAFALPCPQRRRLGAAGAAQHGNGAAHLFVILLTGGPYMKQLTGLFCRPEATDGRRGPSPGYYRFLLVHTKFYGVQPAAPMCSSTPCCWARATT